VTENVCPPTVKLALRELVSEFAATLKLIVVVPVPLDGTPVIQEGTPLLVHAHVEVVFTSNVDAPPAAVALWLLGLKVKLHVAAAAAWVIANVWPPMLMFALRWAGSGFGATVKLIVVVPVPLAGTPVIQEGTPLLVQVQPDVVLTSNALPPPEADALWLDGVSEKLHAAPACVTAKVSPPIVMFALREAGSGFAATVKLMVVGPEPLAGTPEIHAGTPPLVHAQPDGVFTSNALELPAAPALCPVGLSE
jgi:hypothetical protein